MDDTVLEWNRTLVVLRTEEGDVVDAYVMPSHPTFLHGATLEDGTLQHIGVWIGELHTVRGPWQSHVSVLESVGAIVPVHRPAHFWTGFRWVEI